MELIHQDVYARRGSAGVEQSSVADGTESEEIFVQIPRLRTRATTSNDNAVVLQHTIHDIQTIPM